MSDILTDAIKSGVSGRIVHHISRLEDREERIKVLVASRAKVSTLHHDREFVELIRELSKILNE